MAAPITEPVLTWNLFVTVGIVPLCVSILYGALRRLLDRKDTLQQQNLELWQEGAKERNKTLTDKIDNLERCFIVLKKELTQKVDTHTCEVNHARVHESIEKIQERMYT